MTSYITRIAPSPTGNFHIGTARTAYFNWLAAKSSGGKFFLRIDDTDTSRCDSIYVEQIKDSLNWLDLDNDGLFFQSQRKEIYQAALSNLLSNKRAVIDSEGVARLNVDLTPPTWKDRIAGEIKISEDDKVSILNLPLARSDGQFLYHFTSVVDDIDLGINFIIRGNDHLSNTSRQVAIWTALNAPIPEFAHVSLIKKDNKKLSKRDGAASLLAYRDWGFDPDAMLNFLLKLGWGPKLDDKSTAVIWRQDAIKLFLEGGNLKSGHSNFDQAKLESFDRKYKARKNVRPKTD